MTTTGQPVPAVPHPPSPPSSSASAVDTPVTSDRADAPAVSKRPAGAELRDPSDSPGPPGRGHRRQRGRWGRLAWHWRPQVHPLTIAARTVSKAWGDRVLGLSAEAGFWQLLSLPPLLLAILGTIGYFSGLIGQDSLNSIEHSLLRGAGDLLTPKVVGDVVQPTVDQILRRGRPDVISIGFVLSLWTGSASMATYVNTITIASAPRARRGAVRSRLLALRLYLAEVLTGVVVLPGLVVGPDLMERLLSGRHDNLVHTLVSVLFWPVAITSSLTILMTLYHLALPDRLPWRRAFPGAALAVVLWIFGSYLLRVYLEIVFGNELVYGSLGAPVAVLLFFYITALAVLLGAELNATLEFERRSREHSAPPERPATPSG
ncbi:MAG: YihY/virulence factor BrkB family protein [Frankia sp.]